MSVRLTPTRRHLDRSFLARGHHASAAELVNARQAPTRLSRIVDPAGRLSALLSRSMSPAGHATLCNRSRS